MRELARRFHFLLLCSSINDLLTRSSSFLFSESVFVVTGDGRTITGILVGHDQVQNLILQSAVERIYTSLDGTERAEEVELGLYVIRGDNVVLISSMEDEEDNDEPPQKRQKEADWKTIQADPLPAIHQQLV